jgi:hypothetical protein
MGDAEEAKALAAEEAAIEMFKVKKLIKSLERARGCVSPLPTRCSFCSGGSTTPCLPSHAAPHPPPPYTRALPPLLSSPTTPPAATAPP